MSRTFRNNNKDRKIVNKEAASYFFNFSWADDDRKVDRIKNGAIIDENERIYTRVLHGHWSRGIPRHYRKRFNKKQLRKMKQDLFNKVRNEQFEEIGGEKLVKNAGYYYY